MITTSSRNGAFLSLLLSVATLHAGQQVTWVKGIHSSSYGSTLVNTSVCADQDNNLIVGGSAYGPVDFGNGPISHAGFDAYLAKYNSAGTLQWGKLAATNGDNTITGIAADASGNIYTSGYFTGTALFGTNSMTATPSSPISFPDGVIVKYNPLGNVLWAATYGGSGNDYPTCIALDATGAPYLAWTYSSTNLNLGTNFTSAGQSDLALAKFSPVNGRVVWAVHYGGTGNELPRSIAVDKDGDLLVCGDFTGQANLGNGPVSTTGGTDIFIAKYSGVNGAPVWVQTLGSTGIDNGVSVCANPLSGQVYFTGHLGGPVVLGGSTNGPGGLYIASYTGAGTFERIRIFNNMWDGVSVSDMGNGIRCDSAGNVVFVGQNGARISFDGQFAVPGGTHAFFAGFSAGLTNQWYVAATGNDGARAVVVDNLGDVTGVGIFSGTANFGGISLTAAYGTSSAFLAKYDRPDAPPPPITPALSLTANSDKLLYSTCDGATFTASVQSGSTNVTGAQISFTLSPPNAGGQVYSSTGLLSDASGTATYPFRTLTYRGTWQCAVSAAKGGYLASQTNFTFNVQ